MNTTAKTVKIRTVCKELGLALPELRKLIARDSTFPPIEWTTPRSGFVWREDFENWKATRHDRAANRRQQVERKAAHISGTNKTKLPDFLRS